MLTRGTARWDEIPISSPCVPEYPISSGSGGGLGAPSPPEVGAAMSVANGVSYGSADRQTHLLFLTI